MKLSDLASGKWPEILLANGFSETELNGKHQKCGACGGTDRFRFIRNDPNGGFFCGDLRGDGFALLKHRFGINFAEAAKLVERVVGKGAREPVDDKYLKQQQRIERACKPVSGPVEQYLNSRGLEPVRYLRMANLTYWDHDGDKPVKGATYPTMVARLTSPSGATAAFHLTYIDGGRKANVASPRKIVAAKKEIRGSAIRLFPAGEELGVAEGIETALAAHILFKIPVWAVANTALMRGFEVPKDVKCLTVFADRDKNHAGEAAAHELAYRMSKKVEVCVEVPKIFGDWADMLVAG